MPKLGALVGLAIRSGEVLRNYTSLDVKTGAAKSIASLGAFFVDLEDGPKALDLVNDHELKQAFHVFLSRCRQDAK